MVDGIYFFTSFWEAIKELPDEDRLSAYDALMEYAFTGEELEVSGVAKAILIMAKPVLASRKKNAERGAKGAEAKKAKALLEEEEEPTASQLEVNSKSTSSQAEEEPKSTANDKGLRIKDKGQGIIKDTPHSPPKGETAFKPPSVEEVADYIFQMGYSFDAEEFVAYYASQKWKKANGRPLSDWQAACRTWECKRKARSGTTDDWNRMMSEWAKEEP